MLLEAVDDGLLEFELRLELLAGEPFARVPTRTGAARLAVDPVVHLHRLVDLVRRTQPDDCRGVPSGSRLAGLDAREAVPERDVDELLALGGAELDGFGGRGPAGGGDWVPGRGRGTAQDRHGERRGDEDLLDAGFDKERVELAQGEVLELEGEDGGNESAGMESRRAVDERTVWWQ